VAHPIHSVQLVSDGILIEFTDGTCGYFPANFLLETMTDRPSYVFLNYDPSPMADKIDASPIPNRSSSGMREPVSH
jgi:hypothetical protein